MARAWASVVGVLVAVVGLAVPAQGAASPPPPPADRVVGGGAAGIFLDISVDASSDPSGGHPSGRVSFDAEVYVPFRGVWVLLTFEGPVTCLAVKGNRAVIGFDAFLGPMKAVVVDNGSTGSPADQFGVTPTTTDCSDETGVSPVPLAFGDIVVRDAPARPRCLDAAGRICTGAGAAGGAAAQ